MISPSHLAVGPHSITLTATDSEGASASASIDVTVVPPLPAHVNVGVPLIDMASVDTYRGFRGQLYDGSNSSPADHAIEGRNRARTITGTAVFMSIGMSNAMRHFDDFLTRIGAPGSLNPNLVVVNGAQASREVNFWDNPNDATYAVAASRLEAAGVSESDVVAIWLLQVNRRPSVPLPASDADALQLVRRLGNVLRAAKTRYPSLRQVFLSSRIYSCATSGLNPEPFAYESGFAVKWLIRAQIDQIRTGRRDALAGDLDYRTGVAPWIAWGPYLWADGDNPRGDGLSWVRSDLEADCVHPTSSGTSKVSELLLDFFGSSDFTTPWFLP